MKTFTLESLDYFDNSYDLFLYHFHSQGYEKLIVPIEFEPLSKSFYRNDSPKFINLLGGFYTGFHSYLTCESELRIGGSATITFCNNLNFTKRLVVAREFTITNSSVITLPENLYVGRTLTLRTCEHMKLPEGLRVCGDLIIDRTPIESLPENYDVGGKIILQGSNVPLSDNEELLFEYRKKNKIIIK